MLRPGSTREVAQVLAIAHEAGIGIVPQGGNTGLVGGQIPSPDGLQVVLSLSRLSSVRDVDGAGGTMIVEAGVSLAAAKAAADRAGRLFPLSLPSEGSCQIGGVLATNAGGVGVLAYGNARALTLGVEVVTAEGQVWDGLRTLKKDNTGYDLRDLFVGSEGTLGIITAAALKLQPRPAAGAHRAGDAADARCRGRLLGLARRARRRPDRLRGDERLFAGARAQALSATTPRRCRRHRGPCCSSSRTPRAKPRRRGARGAALDSARARPDRRHGDRQERRAGERDVAPARIDHAGAGRGRPEHQARHLAAGLGDPRLRRLDRRRARAGPARHPPVDFGHLGDGNLHYNVQCRDGEDPVEFLRHEAEVNRIVYDAVAARQGSVSAEHGIGRLKLDEMTERKSPVALAMMRAIKSALDPSGVLNPGRVLPPPATR